MPRVQLCLSFLFINVVAESQGIERIKQQIICHVMCCTYKINEKQCKAVQ